MPSHATDPIAAIATAPGVGAVGIVRASAPDLRALMRELFGRELPPRRATLLGFDERDGRRIDSGLAIYFPKPASYTGEDVLELQAHGGPVVLQLLLARVIEAGAAIGLRPARPGEFTERAFLNDKLDLAQAEAVADLIEASTEAAARSASRSLAGAFSAEVKALADALIELRTLVEATLDFPDEEIDFLREADARGRLQALSERLQAVRATARQGALLREGLRVVLAGQPNVGKSSLLNALAGAELAIVTPIPGTTRDRIGQTIQIDGVPLHVIDTAGLRESADEVERLGVGRSWAAIEEADAVVLLRDAARRGEPAYEAADAAIRQRMLALAGDPARVLEVWNKADLAEPPAGSLALSALTGRGLDALRRALLQLAGWQAQPEGLYMARARHLQALGRCAAALDAASAQLDSPAPALELLAEDLRLAHGALGEITGEFTSDDLLGAIFGRFCIGK